jgi:hypothetical protein
LNVAFGGGVGKALGGIVVDLEKGFLSDNGENGGVDISSLRMGLFIDLRDSIGDVLAFFIALWRLMLPLLPEKRFKFAGLASKESGDCTKELLLASPARYASTERSRAALLSLRRTRIGLTLGSRFGTLGRLLEDESLKESGL